MSKKLTKLLIKCCSLLLLCSASCAADNQMFQEISSGLDAAMLRNTDFVWPACGWEKLPVVLVDAKTSTAYCWNKLATAKTVAQLERVDYRSLPSDLTGKSWSSANYYSNTTLSMDLGLNNYDLDKIYILLCHEGFHIVGQSTWNIAVSSRRGDSYPQDWYARFLRRQMAYCLYNALNTNDFGQVQQAAYWQNLYCELYPEELEQNRGYDRLESTAEYVGICGAAIALTGSTDKNVIFPVELRLINQLWKSKYSNFAYSGSAREGEAYYIGMLAGMCMDVYKIDGWKQVVEHGKTPMEVLSERVLPQIGLPNFQLSNQTYNYYKKQNQQLGAIVKKFEADNNNSELFALALSVESIQGTLERKGMINYSSDDYLKMLIFGMSAKFMIRDNAVEMRNAISAIVPLADKNGTVNGYYLVHTSGEYERESGILTASGSVVCVNLPVRLISSAFGVNTLIAD